MLSTPLNILKDREPVTRSHCVENISNYITVEQRIEVFDGFWVSEFIDKINGTVIKWIYEIVKRFNRTIYSTLVLSKTL